MVVVKPVIVITTDTTPVEEMVATEGSLLAHVPKGSASLNVMEALPIHILVIPVIGAGVGLTVIGKRAGGHPKTL